MAIKTIFYSLIFFILISCASNDSSDNKENENESNNSSGTVYIKLSNSKNAVVGNNNQFNQNGLLDDVSELLTYQSGDLIDIESTISDGSYPSKLYPVSSDYKLIEYVTGNSNDQQIEEVYLVLSNDVAIPLSLIGIPSQQNGGTKNKKRMYQREDNFYWLSEGDLIEVALSGDFLVNSNVIESNVKNFELQPNFIHYESNVGQFIYKFNDKSKKRLNSDFNAEFKDFVFRSSTNCLQSETNNDRGQYKEFEELCVDENGNETIRYARSGYLDCLDDPSTPAWCQGASQSFGITQSLSSCSTVNINTGFMFCNNSTRPIFYEMRNQEEQQIKVLDSTVIPSVHLIINQYFDFDDKNLYMISGNDGSLSFTKTDLINKTSTAYDVSIYTKPNWVVFCNGFLDISIDDKFVKFNPSTETFTEVGSNEGIDQYECIE